jgi:predicted nucleotidyltransferase
VIDALVQHIAEHFSPDKIILFGSYAYGQPTRWSDVDLLVVMDVPPEKAAEVMMKILRSLPPRSFGIDVIVHSQATIERRIPQGDWFLKEVIRKGRVMYERHDRRVDR